MASSVNKLKVTVLVGAITVFTGCASVTSPFNQDKSIDAVTDSNTNLQYSEGDYIDRIGRHAYAAVGMGLSRLEPDTSEAIGTDVNDRVEGAGQITIGLDINRMFAVELHSADFGSAGLSPPNGRINYHVNGASALFYVGKQRGNYKRRGLTAYARAGIGILENSPVGNVNFFKDNGEHFLFGAGLEYMTGFGLGLRAEAVSHESDIKYAQLAMIYRIGAKRSKPFVEIVKAPEAPVVMVPALKVVDANIDACNDFEFPQNSLNFRVDSASIDEEGLRVLTDAVSQLIECLDTNIRISAHTDSTGTQAYNQSLSEKRAESVANKMVSSGIDKTRLVIEAFGELNPMAPNTTPAGRQLNRRVDLTVE